MKFKGGKKYRRPGAPDPLVKAVPGVRVIRPLKSRKSKEFLVKEAKEIMQNFTNEEKEKFLEGETRRTLLQNY